MIKPCITHGCKAIVSCASGQWAVDIRTINQVVKGACVAVLVADAGAWTKSVAELQAEGASFCVTYTP